MKDRPPRGLLDTSVFIAAETGRPLKSESMPAASAISSITRAELRVGVFAADTVALRDRRIATLEASAHFPVIPVDDEVARAWAQMRVYLAAAERRVNVNDIWIAATAAAHEIPVLTQDDDFDVLNGIAGLTVIPV
ncbi:MAG TPA: type II toxin-antitoxin system VapC family toxin [Solirubrobacterales bacterium]|nr:type II toxin-antitoxin system VapC family toxin [Solirubrobacterales bacterium]